MSEHQLQTWTEHRRDQARIEALEAELHAARKHSDALTNAYKAALDALDEASWHNTRIVLQHTLWFLTGIMVAVAVFWFLA